MAGARRGPPRRLGFAGTPAFAATILAALLEAGYTPAAVYTQPDRPVGRGRRLTPSAVKTLALQHTLPVHQPASLRDDEEARLLAGLELDALVVAAYGLLLPGAVLTAPRLGCLNVHASLLPRWRGAAPVERAIMAGDTETGVSIMHMERGLDSGPVYLQKRCPITPDTDGPGLEAHLASLGAAALLETLARLPDLAPVPQDPSAVTYAHKLSRADAAIRWDRDAREIERQVRALRGRLPAFTMVSGVRTAILEATVLDAGAAAAPGTIVAASRAGIDVACGAGTLSIQRLQLARGKGRPMTAAEALAGYASLLAPGTVFGDPGSAA